MVCKILNPTTENMEKVASMIQQGYIAAFSTDTVFALVTSSLRPESIKKIFKIKNREHKKSLPLLVDRVERILPFITPQDKVMEVIEQQSRPTTYVVKAKNHIPFITNPYHQQSSIAFRIPQDHISRTILSYIKEPIVATSANISGDRNNKNIQDIIKSLGDISIDFAIQPDDNYQISQPSTILDIRYDKHITLR